MSFFSGRMTYVASTTCTGYFGYPFQNRAVSTSIALSLTYHWSQKGRASVKGASTSKKLKLQAFFTATALTMLRACAWLAESTHVNWTSRVPFWHEPARMLFDPEEHHIPSEMQTGDVRTHTWSGFRSTLLGARCLSAHSDCQPRRRERILRETRPRARDDWCLCLVKVRFAHGPSRCWNR
jgi:hypothetical protein